MKVLGTEPLFGSFLVSQNMQECSKLYAFPGVGREVLIRNSVLKGECVLGLNYIMKYIIFNRRHFWRFHYYIWMTQHVRWTLLCQQFWREEHYLRELSGRPYQRQGSAGVSLSTHKVVITDGAPRLHWLDSCPYWTINLPEWWWLANQEGPKTTGGVGGAGVRGQGSAGGSLLIMWY